MNFLLVYSYNQERLITVDQFTETTEALDAYRAAERKFDSLQHEVVLLGADSLDAIRRNHGHYFREDTSTAPFIDLLD